ncbi:MAG: histidinol dehydrogenase [bacterium]
MINRFRWKDLPPAGREKILRRAESDITALIPLVLPIVEAVRAEGDRALVRFAGQYDRVELRTGRLRVTRREQREAAKKCPPRVRAAIEIAMRNIERHHRRQMPQPLALTTTEEGSMAGEKITPIASCGLYVPRGKGSFPSVMMMLGVPAMVAGVERVIVCTPPGPDGEVDPATLVAAGACGVSEIYRAGGAQAIAAMAFGTETVPKVDKVLGPGSGYVAAAKRLLYGIVDVGLPAGPSESIILADASTDPRLAAADLLIEAEHGPDSTALLVTHDAGLARKVESLLPALLRRIPAGRREFCEKVLAGYGGIIITENLRESIGVVNSFAPEHLEILTAEPLRVMEKIRNAGEILLGPHTPITMGNFCAGVNAVLPSGGFARTCSGLTVHDFMKRTAVVSLSRAGFERLADTACALAEYEGFPAHSLAVKTRLAKKKPTPGKGKRK